MCVNHPDIPSSSTCRSCGKPVCLTCEFQLPNGHLVCPECANAPPVLRMEPSSALVEPPPLPTEPPPWPTEPPPIPVQPLPSSAGSATTLQMVEPPPIPILPQYARPTLKDVRCVQHSTVPAVELCKICNAPMCATCDFLIPGNIHVCPVCISAPPRKMSLERKLLVTFALILAAWTTLGMALLAGGFFNKAGMVDQKTLGILFSIFIFFPSLIGTALGISSHEKRLSNPASVWIAAIWNGVNMAVLLVLVIIGNLK
jgi:hypothetical protein